MILPLNDTPTNPHFSVVGVAASGMLSCHRSRAEMLTSHDPRSFSQKNTPEEPTPQPQPHVATAPTMASAAAAAPPPAGGPTTSAKTATGLVSANTPPAVYLACPCIRPS